MRRVIIYLSFFFWVTTTANATNWFIRHDGGARYDSANNSTGDSCDGKGDAAVIVSGGPNQHCAFKDFRLLFNEPYQCNIAPNPSTCWGWIISGGDVIIIRGCNTGSGTTCRIGWDNGTANSSDNPQCWWAPDPFGSNFNCYNPPIPSGTSLNPTIIESGAVYDGTANKVFDTPTYIGNGAQLFGGFGDQAVLNLQSTQYVQIKDIEITTHNGACTQYGDPAWPAPCNRGTPGASDWASSGILTNTSTANILLQDINIHGMGASAIYGPVGGPITMTRVLMNFNVFAGWLFDNGVDNNAPGSTMNARGVWCTGNGFLEQYPIVNTEFPAKAGWDDNSNGFGDACWSGQGKGFVKQWDSFTWIGGTCRLNVKDCGLGPEALVHNLDVEQILSYGNMGAVLKFNTDANSTVKYYNNKLFGNPLRLSQIVPGASQTFNLSSGLTGAYLSDFGRGADTVPYSTDAGTNVTIAGNTILSYYPTVFDIQTIPGGDTTTATINLVDNVFIGYSNNGSYYPGNGQNPGLYYLANYSGTINANHNAEYGLRSGTCPGGTGMVCADPVLLDEVAQGAWPAGTESVFDAFIENTWIPITGSPVIGTGSNISELTVDFYNNSRPSPPSMGAVEPTIIPVTVPTSSFYGTISIYGNSIKY